MLTRQLGGLPLNPEKLAYPYGWNGEGGELLFLFVKVLLMCLFSGQKEGKRLYDIFQQVTNQIDFKFD